MAEGDFDVVAYELSNKGGRVWELRGESDELGVGERGSVDCTGGNRRLLEKIGVVGTFF